MTRDVTFVPHNRFVRTMCVPSSEMSEKLLKLKNGVRILHISAHGTSDGNHLLFDHGKEPGKALRMSVGDLVREFTPFKPREHEDGDGDQKHEDGEGDQTDRDRRPSLIFLSACYSGRRNLFSLFFVCRFLGLVWLPLVFLPTVLWRYVTVILIL